MSQTIKTKIEQNSIPLAEKLRPKELDEFMGQENILGRNSTLRKLIEGQNLSSSIFWGPPGCGKTTIARLIEKKSNLKFHKFSAVFSSIKEVRKVMQEAEDIFNEKREKSILFIDEIHRFNKSQQDALLPYVESGSVILIGATTENPSFEIISALLSRLHLFVLEKLSDVDIEAIIKRANKKFGQNIKIEEKALNFLIEQSMGDARRAINNFEILLKFYQESVVTVTLKDVANILSKKTYFYDKKGEEHYNIISALHKAMRGSDTQASIYWLSRMLEAGEDPMFIVRRLVRFASEDVGLSDPNALSYAIATKEAVHFLGMPEAGVHITGLVVYLATAPKSNSLYSAYNEAKKDALKTASLSVPMHIRNAPTKMMEELGYSKDYKYSHNFKNGYSYQKYFPDIMKEKNYYTPSKFGFEKEIKKRLDWWEKLKREGSKK